MKTVKPITITLPPEVIKLLIKQAKRNFMNRSEYIKSLILEKSKYHE